MFSRAYATAEHGSIVHPVVGGYQNISDGRDVFLQNCSGCHGRDANGQSPGGRALRPIAFDLSGFRLSNDTIWRALQQGVPGSSMPSWNDLPSAEFASVAAYVHSIGVAPDLTPAQQIASDAVLMEAGRRVFDTNCARCHSDNLDGRGPDATQYLPRPANFHHIMPSFKAATRIMHEGVPGSGMPAFPLLTSNEIQAVTCYMRSFYQGSRDTQPPPPPDSTAMPMGGTP